MLRKILVCLALFVCAHVSQAQNRPGDVAAEFWHKIFSASIGIDDNRVQLYQGGATVGTSSRWLWNIFNTVIANGSTYYYDPAQINSFSSNYDLIMYDAKVTDTVNKNCDLNDAMLKYINAGDSYAWDKTLEEMLAELSTSKQLKIQLDTTLTGYVNDSNNNLYTVTLKISAKFNQIILFKSKPYAVKNSNNYGLNNQNPWYSPCMLADAYNNVNGNVLSQQDWANLFGAHGSLKRVCDALIVANEVNIVVSAYDNKTIFSVNSSNNTPMIIGVVVSTIADYIAE